ncbi:hypothetical protein M1349_04620 [Patescibacteria group bacterium]|nr:hypothetical protein [Patescibacteria group bacterium]
MKPEISGEQLRELRKNWSEQTKRKFGNTFHFSPDIASAENIVIYPNEPTLVPVSFPKDMPPFIDSNLLETGLASYALDHAEGHTRSRFAQLGLEVTENPGLWISNTGFVSGENIEAKVIVKNYSKRPILLPEGTDFFNLYFWNKKIAMNNELRDIIGSKIQISGIEGQDWRYWYCIDGYGEDLLAGIELKINPDSRSWIPPSSEPMVISGLQAENHNRSAVDEYLESPIPQSEKKILWIAETSSRLKLNGVTGILSMAVSPAGMPIKTHENGGFQTNSVVLQDGNTDSHIRTEIFSATLEDQIPQHVLVHFTKPYSVKK